MCSALNSDQWTHGTQEPREAHKSTEAETIPNVKSRITHKERTMGLNYTQDAFANVHAEGTGESARGESTEENGRTREMLVEY